MVPTKNLLFKLPFRFYVQGAASSLSAGSAAGGRSAVPAGSIPTEWPEPGLLGIRALVDVAQKAQVERLEDRVETPRGLWIACGGMGRDGEYREVLDNLFVFNPQKEDFWKVVYLLSESELYSGGFDFNCFW